MCNLCFPVRNFKSGSLSKDESLVEILSNVALQLHAHKRQMHIKSETQKFPPGEQVSPSILF